MTNGKDFDWEQITPGQKPYEGRDPRFYKTVLCNGDTWMNSTIQSYEGGKDGHLAAGSIIVLLFMPGRHCLDIQ